MPSCGWAAVRRVRPIVFLPLDPFALLTGKSLAEAALPEKKVYASLQTSQPVNLRDLFRLMGRDFSGEEKPASTSRRAGSPEAPASRRENRSAWTGLA